MSTPFEPPPRRRFGAGRWRTPVWIGAVLAAAGVAVATYQRPPDAVQPFPFNHKVHITAKIDCLQCHMGVVDAEQPHLPPLSTCTGCHKDPPPADNPKKLELARLAGAGKALDWRPLFRVPDHVFFSHPRHVDVAELECASCHGDMLERTEPPMYAATIGMSACIKCHEGIHDPVVAKRAALDCAACHR